MSISPNPAVPSLTQAAAAAGAAARGPGELPPETASAFAALVAALVPQLAAQPAPATEAGGPPAATAVDAGNSGAGVILATVGTRPALGSLGFDGGDAGSARVPPTEPMSPGLPPPPASAAGDGVQVAGPVTPADGAGALPGEGAAIADPARGAAPGAGLALSPEEGSGPGRADVPGAPETAAGGRPSPLPGSAPVTTSGRTAPHPGATFLAAPAGHPAAVVEAGQPVPSPPASAPGDGSSPSGPAEVAGAAAAAGAPGPSTVEVHAPREPASTSPAPLPPHRQVVAVVAPLRQDGDGAWRLSLRLHPEELGHVQVDVELHAGEVRLHLRADDQGAAAALRQSLPELRAELEAAGFRTGALDVGGRDGGHQAGDQPAPRLPGGAGGPGPATEDDVTLPTPSSRGPRSASLDIRL